MKNKSELAIILITVAVLETLLYGVNQVAFERPFHYFYIGITVVFAVIEVLFCLNMEKFFSNNAGVKMFFIYKACKFLFLLCPMVVYVFAVKHPDVWIAVRTSVYYFIFLIEETLMSLKYQRN